MKRKPLRMVLAIVLIAVASPFVLMAIYVDDWSRDLSQNTAATDPEHTDERLRPAEVAASTEEVKEKLQTFCTGESAWTLVGEKSLPADSPLLGVAALENSETHHLTHVTGLMRYKDDVWLVVERTAKGAKLHGDSRSRIGKGDLGQNPRNLREILGELRSSF